MCLLIVEELFPDKRRWRKTKQVYALVGLLVSPKKETKKASEGLGTTLRDELKNLVRYLRASPTKCRSRGYRKGGHFLILMRFIDPRILLLMIFIDPKQGLKKTCKLVV